RRLQRGFRPEPRRDVEEQSVPRCSRDHFREAQLRQLGRARAQRHSPSDPDEVAPHHTVAHPTAARQTSSPTPGVSTLERRLGPIDAAAIIVSNVIGGGILFTPPLVAASVPNPWLFLATWVAGGALAFSGAMAYAELAALRPRAGGEYVYLRAAYGRLAAFLTGWTSFVAGFSGAIAASAVVLSDYLGRFLPVAKDTSPLLT